MTMTFGQRLKKHRKNSNLTQQELAETIGVSAQAVSKWETDAGMPDISQIVPLSRVLNVSSDILLGIADEDNSAEFDVIYQKCMEIEAGNPCSWPPEASKAEKGFGMMYDYFCAHPNNAKAAKYLLDMAELYFGKFGIFENEAEMVKECERFAGCIMRYSDSADLHAEANYLMASVWARVGDMEKAEQCLAKMPFRYGDGCYWSAEVARIGGNYKKAEVLCKESFTYRARFLTKCLRLTAASPNVTQAERLEYEEYMLRLINALLSGGDAMPYTQIYQKMTLLSSLVQRHLNLGNQKRALECLEELIDTGEKYLAYLAGGSQGTQLLLLDDRIEVFGNSDCRPLREMVVECLNRAVSYIHEKGVNEIFEVCIARANKISVFID